MKSAAGDFWKRTLPARRSNTSQVITNVITLSPKNSKPPELFADVFLYSPFSIGFITHCFTICGFTIRGLAELRLLRVGRDPLMARKLPVRLTEKLLAVRTRLAGSQRGLIRAINMEGELSQAEISMFEKGTRQPNLIVLRKYAVLARIWIDYLVKDEWELPQ
ncbi:MAG: hypothetical protein ABIP06_10335 [Pyrinomonadaceae bacterium]